MPPPFARRARGGGRLFDLNPIRGTPASIRSAAAPSGSGRAAKGSARGSGARESGLILDSDARFADKVRCMEFR